MSQPVSEHRLRLRFGTIAAASMLLAMTLICLAGSSIFLYLTATGAGYQEAALWAAPAAGLAAIFGYVTWRFITRVLSIRRIRLFSPSMIELLTWRGNVLRAELPASIEDVIIIDQNITLHLKIGTHRLIISAEDFSESATIRSWLQTSGLQIRF